MRCLVWYYNRITESFLAPCRNILMAHESGMEPAGARGICLEDIICYEPMIHWRWD